MGAEITLHLLSFSQKMIPVDRVGRASRPTFTPCLQGGNTKGGIFMFRGGEAAMTIPANAGIQNEANGCQLSLA